MLRLPSAGQYLTHLQSRATVVFKRLSAPKEEGLSVELQLNMDYLQVGKISHTLARHSTRCPITPSQQMLPC